MQQEVRFALVMYGGASLAVYMNGVTQEFFHLVRATASNGASPNGCGAAAGTEAVYRELAAMVNSRFVVDIISGSSAGGINAIFLGKALANGWGLEKLSRLWLEEADVTCLWNKARRPRSVLSGRAVYAMLKRALNAMDEDAMDDGEASGAWQPDPLQPEIDVFVTATDIQGLELPLPVMGGKATEKRHKNVFHLRFGGRENDFTPAANPFLAFAARATSSFPVAFEPARLADYAPAAEAARFFPDYVAAQADYAERAFGDGGYLNNKPFHYALGEIPRRVSDLPVRRMLVYVEPTPERAGGNSAKSAPGPIRNSIEALITLHQYETIREDLREVLNRNGLVERVREITAQVDRDVAKWRGAMYCDAGRLPGAEYAGRTLSEEIRARGPAYAGYHRLKIRAVTEELARMARLSLPAVDQWRAANYREEDPASTESLFLLHFDLGYRQRRLRFLLRRLDEAGGPSELRGELARIARNLTDIEVEPVSMDAIRQALREAMIPAAEQAERCLEGTPLKRYFDYYEDYDQVTFPIFYETQVGETEPVEIFRVSPLDARSVIDEASPAERRRKLAGTALFDFGAFLKRSWRVNDMLWGRLDGAERMIESVLPPGSGDAPRLVREAHLAILRESFGERAEDAYHHVKTNLKTAYWADRRVGIFTGVRTLLRTAWILLRMSFCLH